MDFINESGLSKQVQLRPNGQYHNSPDVVMRIVRYELFMENESLFGRYNYQRPFIPVGVIKFSNEDDLWGTVETPELDITTLDVVDQRVLGLEMITMIEESPSLILLYKSIKEVAFNMTPTLKLVNNDPSSTLFFTNLSQAIHLLPDECWFKPVNAQLTNQWATEHQDQKYGAIIFEKR